MKIFLDIDGVMVKAIPHLQPEFENDGFYKFNSNAVGVLNQLLEEDDEIVLTTSHRFSFSIEEWEVLFEARGIKKVPISRIDAIAMGTRKDMIENWISENEIEEFLIIDDDKSLRGLPDEMLSHLILTDPYIGLDY